MNEYNYALNDAHNTTVWDYDCDMEETIRKYHEEPGNNVYVRTEQYAEAADNIVDTCVRAIRKAILKKVIISLYPNMQNKDFM